jgi:integrase
MLYLLNQPTWVRRLSVLSTLEGVHKPYAGALADYLWETPLTLKRNTEWKPRWATPKQPMQRKEGSQRLEGYEGATEQAGWFFGMADGAQIITLIDQFKALLKTCGLKKNRYGEEYTLYSLRHFYAVQMLRRGKASIFDLARNMGTSVQIIERYYGKDATPLALATKLGG